MDYILLVISIAACLTATLQKNSFSKGKAKNTSDMHMFNLLGSTVCAVLFLLLALFSGGVSTYTVILGIIFGVVTAFSAVFSLQAFKKGPASYTNLLIMSSMILPALSGAVLFNEALSVTKIIGIVLMLIAITLSVLNKNEDKKASLGWLTLSLSAALCVGVVGILQKVHQSSPAKDELMWFLCIAFTVSASFSVLYVLLNRSSSVSIRLDRPTLLFTLGYGVAVMLNNAINLYLSGVMQSAIFFPTVNGANIVLLLIVSLVFLKERLRKLQWFGIAAGFIAIMLLCI